MKSKLIYWFLLYAFVFSINNASRQQIITCYYYPLDNWDRAGSAGESEHKAFVRNDTLFVLGKDSLFHTAVGYYSFLNGHVFAFDLPKEEAQRRIDRISKDTTRAYCNGVPCNGVFTLNDAYENIVVKNAKFKNGIIDMRYPHSLYRNGKRIIKIGKYHKIRWEYDDNNKLLSKTVYKRYTPLPGVTGFKYRRSRIYSQ